MNGRRIENISDVWRNVMQKFPGKTAVIYEGKSWTYAECDAMIEAMRRNLALRFGLKQGDRVAYVLPNCFEFFVAYWAAIRSGAVVTPVNVRLRPEEMGYVIANSDAQILFVHEQTHVSAREALKHAPNVKHVIGVGVPEAEAQFEELVRAESTGCEQPVPHIRTEDLAIIMHTSGTTGRPKGAMMRHADLLFNIKNAIISHGFRHEDVHLLWVPMFHCTALYSMLPTAAYQGSTIVVAPRPDVKELVQLVEKHRITTWLGVPTMFYFLGTLKDLASHDLSCLKLIAYAGSPMPPQTIKRLREKLPHVQLRNFFGLTETISVTHVLPDGDALKHPDSVGKLLPEVHHRIIDEQGKALKPGEVGELCFARENVVTGYWKQPELLAKSMIGDWFRTGDLAMVDEDGYVFLKGRKKDMIIVGGENVYALEVESVILTHDKVLEVAVVGVEAKGIREYLGELVKAVVVPKQGMTLTELDIKRHCSGHLATYKIPQLVEFRDKLPRNPAGKVMKNELK